MDVKVLFFARSRELTGTQEARVTLPEGSTTAALLERLMALVSWWGRRSQVPRSQHRLR